MSASRQVVHLHTHSEYSVFDGCGKQDAFIQRAKDMGNPAIAFTEHGSMRGVYKADESSKTIEGIKAIHGVEFYMCDDMASRGLSPDQRDAVLAGLPPKCGLKAKNEAIYQEEVRLGLRGRFHITALAKDNVGLKNLFRLSSLGWLRGYYKRPRIDLKTLGEYRQGIIVLSGCLSGVLNHKILQGQFREAIALAEQMKEWFGEDFYLEVMAHPFPDQIRCNKALIKLAEALDIKIVATQDAHWINPDDREAQECLLCIHTGDVLSNPERFRFEAGDFWLKTREELEETFRRDHGYFPEHLVQASLDETLAIAEKITCKVEIDRFKALVPPVEIPPEFKGDEFAYLRHLCMQGWDTRAIVKRSQVSAIKLGVPEPEMYKRYIARLKHELGAIQKQKVVRYFLVIWDMYNWARKAGIAVGPGRGSAGGCLVSFLLNIVDIDPLENGLIFERFLAPGRIDLPDIDCDFEARRRDEVIDYLKDKYGHDKTAQIATVGTLKGKAALRDISRVLEVPRREVDEVADSIVERSSGDERASNTLEDSFKEFKVCQEFNRRHPKVLELAKKLEGQARNLGMHAAGVVVSPEPLIDIVPLELRFKSKYANGQNPDTAAIVTAFDMYGAAGFGLMKIDVLGLRNLDCMVDCMRMVETRHGRKIDLDWDVDLNDPAVLANFTALRFKGIFQYDTPGSEKICSGVNFESFEDVVAMIALNRPGTARSGLATEYIKRKADKKARKSIHPVVDGICSDTLGVIVYQEHVLRIFTDVAGFNPATADSLRKKIAKKWGDEAIGKERENFINGAVGRGFPRGLAEDLISKITFFGSYGFNKSHATAYGLTAYRQMWLKTYYPLEFMWSLLANEPDPKEITQLVKSCRAEGIEVSPPDINASSVRWSISGTRIVASLMDLKGVGEKAVQAIQEGQPYTSFRDFAQRIDRRRCNRRVVDVMIRAGAMKSLVTNQKFTHENLERLWELAAKERWDDLEAALEEGRSAPDWTEDEASILAAEVNPLSFGKHPLEPYADFITRTLRVPWVALDDEGLFDHEQAFICGMILEVKYNQVGDFHTGPAPDEDEKRRMKWGARYANINVEDMTGKQIRVKVDWDIFDDFRHVVDQGEGTPIALSVSLNKKFGNARAHYLVDIGDLKKRVDAIKALPEEEQEPRARTDLTPYERMLTEWNPAAVYSTKDIRRLADRLSVGTRYTVTGLVTSLSRKLDKRGNEMAFFGIQGGQGHLDCLCFASCWSDFQDKLAPGRIVRIRLKRDKSREILDNDSVENVVVVEG